MDHCVIDGCGALRYPLTCKLAPIEKHISTPAVTLIVVPLARVDVPVGVEINTVTFRLVFHEITVVKVTCTVTRASSSEGIYYKVVVYRGVILPVERQGLVR